MRTKIFALGLVAALAATLTAVPSHAAKKKAPKPMVVGTDPAGDWGSNVNATISPLGENLGQDLVKATLFKKDAKTLNFIIQLSALPPTGGTPEFTRYTWEFTVNGRPMQLSGAFTDYIRGICNPTYNPSKCPPPRDPGQTPFFIREGECAVGTDGIRPCEEKAHIKAAFDQAKATITVPVPMKAIGAKPGTKIGPGASLFGPALYSAPAVFLAPTQGPHDTLNILKTYKVPR